MESNALGLDDVVGAMPQAAAVLDRAGVVVTCNEAWTALEPALLRLVPPPATAVAGTADDAEPDTHAASAVDVVDAAHGEVGARSRATVVGLALADLLAGARVEDGVLDLRVSRATDPVLPYVDHRPSPAEALRDVIAGAASSASERFVLDAVGPGSVARVVEVRVRAIRDGSPYVLATCHVDESETPTGVGLADRHPVTGLIGRRLLLEHLGQAMTMAGRHRFRPATLAVGLVGVADLDDRLGVGAHDELVTAIASRLRAGLRPGDVVAHVETDTFVVMLPDVDGAYLAETVSARLATDVARPVKLPAARVDPGLAIGIAIADHLCSPSEVLFAAESALGDAVTTSSSMVLADGYGYEDAEVTRGRSTASGVSSDRRIDVAELREEELITYLQPIFDLTDHHVVAGEALMRWRHPHYGVLSAGEFLGLAINAGMLPTLTDQALVTAAETWADIRESLGPEPPRLFVNLSPEQLLSRVAVRRLYDLLIATGVPAGDVVVEVTEEAMSTRFDDMVTVLGEIRDQGIRVALDDFGSGYSSLGRLRHLPVDVLKVDQSLVRGLESDRRARQVLAAVATISVELDVECVVEGIETAGEAAIVGDLGFRYVQGYHFARPMPAVEFAAISSLGLATATDSLG